MAKCGFCGRQSGFCTHTNSNLSDKAAQKAGDKAMKQAGKRKR